MSIMNTRSILSVIIGLLIALSVFGLYSPGETLYESEFESDQVQNLEMELGWEAPIESRPPVLSRGSLLRGL